MMQFAKRIAIVIAGMTVLLIGILMILTPGPATLVIMAGLAILANEFPWAHRSLQLIKKVAASGADKLKIGMIFQKIQTIFSMQNR
jgi:tellurite resistance protein TerC